MKPSQYLLWLGSAIALTIGVTWVLLTSHAATTHPSGVTRNEMVLIKEHIDSKFNRVYTEIDLLRQEIKGLNR